jgi:acetyl esterase/lipase
MLRNLLVFAAGLLLASVFFIAKPLLSPAPPSVYASTAAIDAAANVRELLKPYMVDLMTASIERRRAILDEHFFAPKIALARKLYPVTETVEEIDGVYTETFTPADGVAAQNTNKVLINLHGGGFSMGARTEGRLESIPIANVAGMRIVSVDYRQGPEHQFPAASEDVATVYRHLLKHYQPENIGIFGCSAGGLLTAQSIAWFAANALPQPGAIGIFCAGAGVIGSGDSGPIADLFGTNLGGTSKLAYFEGASWDDPLVAPQEHPAVLAQFPPTLLITSTRDFAMSTALVTHQRLVSANIEAQLHVYEGLNHYFFADTELDESRHAFNVIAKFFQQQLGKTNITASRQ